MWHLIAFAIHQIRANGRPADALFRQQQALLRSLPTPSTVMIDTLKLWWVWRKKADRPFLRSIILVLLAFGFAAATIAASVFSSLVVSSGTIPVLVDSPLCGFLSETHEGWYSYKVPVDISAPAYAKDCYKNNSLPSTCNVFMRPNIPLKVEDAPCPFWAKSMCDSKDAVTVDSGLVDVSDAFGLNVPAKDRVRYRRKTTCAVVPTEGHMSFHNDSGGTDEQRLTIGQISGEHWMTLDYSYSKFGPQPTFWVSTITANLSGSPLLTR